MAIKLKTARNTGAITHFHNYFVYNSEKMEIIESAVNADAAVKATSIFNDHEFRNHRPPVYKWIPKDEVAVMPDGAA